MKLYRNVKNRGVYPYHTRPDSSRTLDTHKNQHTILQTQNRLHIVSLDCILYI